MRERVSDQVLTHYLVGRTPVVHEDGRVEGDVFSDVCHDLKAARAEAATLRKRAERAERALVACEQYASRLVHAGEPADLRMLYLEANASLAAADDTITTLRAERDALREALTDVIAEIDAHNAHLGARLCTRPPVVLEDHAALVSLASLPTEESRDE